MTYPVASVDSVVGLCEKPYPPPANESIQLYCKRVKYFGGSRSVKPLRRDTLLYGSPNTTTHTPLTQESGHNPYRDTTI